MPGYDNLDERRRRKLSNIALHVAENENHPTNKLLRDQEVYDEYALRRKLSKPFFIRAQEACATLSVDLGTVESMKELKHKPWINNSYDNMITQLMALAKESGSARIRARGITSGIC
jgi:ribonuclease D